eukprot:10924341-Alexandrium_andersonii.AAC.1
MDETEPRSHNERQPGHGERAALGDGEQPRLRLTAERTRNGGNSHGFHESHVGRAHSGRDSRQDHEGIHGGPIELVIALEKVESADNSGMTFQLGSLSFDAKVVPGVGSADSWHSGIH